MITLIAGFGASLGVVERAEILPFHQMGRYKWERLGLDYKLAATADQLCLGPCYRNLQGGWSRRPLTMVDREQLRLIVALLMAPIIIALPTLWPHRHEPGFLVRNIDTLLIFCAIPYLGALWLAVKCRKRRS